MGEKAKSIAKKIRSEDGVGRTMELIRTLPGCNPPKAG
jgi:hypothetical protein